MKRYRFTMESALRARRAQEDAARQRLAAANHRLTAARQRHANAVAAYQAMSPTTEPVERDAFLGARAHEIRMAQDVERTKKAETQVEVEAAVCYAAWVEAGKQVASLERLDDRRRTEWELDVRREEAAAVDDVVAYRWNPEGERR
ncbi:MAG TPA: hypothetical protein VFH45_08500 [Acidimicrobiales bacterium]|nr:hypothetical protein [Acidimicrobiales bacterium]